MRGFREAVILRKERENMYFYVDDIYVDYVKKPAIVTDNATPVFCWSAVHEQDGQGQSAYEITVKNGDETVWDSGEVVSSLQKAVYAGSPLKSEVSYTVTKCNFSILSDCC